MQPEWKAGYKKGEVRKEAAAGGEVVLTKPVGPVLFVKDGYAVVAASIEPIMGATSHHMPATIVEE